MRTKLNVSLVSRSAPALQALERALAGARDFRVTSRLMSNGHTDPLHGAATPDVLVLRFDEHHLGELATLAEMQPGDRPPVILVGPASNGDAMRLVVRCGARDFLAEPVAADELVQALERVRESLRPADVEAGRITAFVGAAGGVGTSLLACNVAQLLASGGEPTCLVDLDLQFGPLTHFLDLEPKLGLAQALESANTLDDHAMEGYVARHRSGLAVLSSQDATSSRALTAEALAILLPKLGGMYRHVVLDVPNALTPFSATALGMANTIFVVLQQSVVQVKNAALLHRLLTRELGVPAERIRIVVNRLTKNAGVSPQDIEDALECGPVVTVPNHFRSARESIDTGVSVQELDPAGPLTRGLQELRMAAVGEVAVARPSLFRRTLPIFTRK